MLKYIILPCLITSIISYQPSAIVEIEHREIPKVLSTKAQIKQMLEMKALENDINPKYLIELAVCESGLVPDIQSRYIQPYGREQSYGLFQIHTKANTSVTPEEAKDPIFNTDWAIDKIKKGQEANQWYTCHKKITSRGIKTT